mmetsp:Transcript_18224/g.37112  ORF Transcript_18224/g.37112 Transcript_18224/m.37112 type:complete len:265 (-) Transcript_18224:32-826(-)
MCESTGPRVGPPNDPLPHDASCKTCGPRAPRRAPACAHICLSRQVIDALRVRRGRLVEVGARGPHPSGLPARVGVTVVALFEVAAAPPWPAAAHSAATLCAAAFVCSHHNRLALELGFVEGRNSSLRTLHRGERHKPIPTTLHDVCSNHFARLSHMILQGAPVDILGQATHEDRIGTTSSSAAAAATAATTSTAVTSGVLAEHEVAPTFLLLVACIRARIRRCLFAATASRLCLIPNLSPSALLFPTTLPARSLDDVVQGHSQL